MIDLALIGIGTGHLDHLTRAAEKAMRAADLVLLPRKRAETGDLLDLRRAICDAVLPGGGNVATFAMPERDAGAPYRGAVADWHAAIADRWRAAIADRLPGGGRVALLVWGDPSLYDSSLRIAADLAAGGLALRVTVVPGITSLQALCAAHRIPLNEVAGAIAVTTGRLLADGGWPAGFPSVAVMLDGACAFAALDPAGIDIWWGAYLGMAGEALVAGPLGEAGPKIRELRVRLRRERGWIMDTYLLRRKGPA